jgi:hypothetical protein
MNKTKQAGGNGWRNEISRCMDCKDFPCAKLENEKICEHFKPVESDTVTTVKKVKKNGDVY